MKDWNICPACGGKQALDARVCGNCGERLLLNSRGAVAFWCMGDVDLGMVRPLMAMVGKRLGRKVILQPARIDEARSARGKGWKGRARFSTRSTHASRGRRPSCLWGSPRRTWSPESDGIFCSAWPIWAAARR